MSENNLRSKGKSLDELVDDYVVVDIETTGIDCSCDEIIEIAAIKYENLEEIASFQSLVKPFNPIDEEVQNLTGITPDMICNAPSISEVLPRFTEFVGKSVLVAHNAHFDVNFLYDALFKNFNLQFKNDFIDTLKLSKRCFKNLKSYSLEVLCDFLEIKNPNAHRALNDCQATNELYLRIHQKAQECPELVTAYQKKKKYKPAPDLRALTPNKELLNEESPIFGKEFVFTGTLDRMKRTDAAQLVVDNGGRCGNSVTKKTNFLVLGNNDFCKSIKDGKSSKQKKAEDLKAKGFDIEVIPEDTFYKMINKSDF